MEEFNGTRLTLEIDGQTAIWESPSRDHSVMDLLQALRGLMVTHTFFDESFIKGCQEMAEDNIDLYVKEKEDD